MTGITKQRDKKTQNRINRIKIKQKLQRQKERKSVGATKEEKDKIRKSKLK